MRNSSSEPKQSHWHHKQHHFGDQLVLWRQNNDLSHGNACRPQHSFDWASFTGQLKQSGFPGQSQIRIDKHLGGHRAPEAHQRNGGDRQTSWVKLILANHKLVDAVHGMWPRHLIKSRSPVWGKAEMRTAVLGQSSIAQLPTADRFAAASSSFCAFRNSPPSMYEVSLSMCPPFQLPHHVFCLLWTCLLLASLDAPVPCTGRTTNPYHKMMLETSITPALGHLFFSAPEGRKWLHLPLNAHIPGKTEQAGEPHTFVQGWNKPLLSICLTYKCLSHFKIDNSCLCSN